MISLDYRDSRPIYQQVKDSLCHLMLSGAIQEGEQLPSVRSLASTLAINPNTIARAYELLEQEKLIYTVAGKGCFVAPLQELTAQRERDLFRELQYTYEELRKLGRSQEEIVHHLSTCEENFQKTQEESEVSYEDRSP